MQWWIMDRNYRRRMRQIVATLARHGLGWLALELGLGKLLPVARFRSKRRPTTGPEHFRMAFEDLGATFIKLGQILSTRPDVLPPEYVEEFSKLQDDAPPVSYEQIAAVVEVELGASPDGVFRTFEHEPVASASIGQVHRAELHDGTTVVVKVQRPEAEDVAERDLDILLELGRMAAQRTSWGQYYDIEGWMREFAFTLRNEFDYKIEASNAAEFKRAFAGDETLYVPTVYRRFSTRRILTLEYLKGIKISNVQAIDASGVDRKRVARESTRIMLTMLFDHGFFHADPHAGNFFVMPDGRIGLMDFGMVGYLDASLRETLLRVVLAVMSQDADRLVDELLVLGIARETVQRFALRQDVQHLMRRYTHRPLKEIAAMSALQDLMNVARRHRLLLPAELVLTAKVMGMAEGIAVQLDPEFEVLSYSQPYVRRFWMHSLRPSNRVQQAKESFLDLMDLSSSIPRNLRRVLRQSEQGSFQLRVRTDPSHDALRQIHRAANRVAFSVLTAALIIGSGLLMLVYHPEGARWFFLVTFAVSALLGMGLLWSVWRSGRL